MYDLVTVVFNDYLVNQVVTLRITLNINTTLHITLNINIRKFDCLLSIHYIYLL